MVILSTTPYNSIFYFLLNILIFWQDNLTVVKSVHWFLCLEEDRPVALTDQHQHRDSYRTMASAEIEKAWKACTSETTGVQVQGGKHCSEALDILITAELREQLVAWAVNQLQSELIENAYSYLRIVGQADASNSEVELSIASTHRVLDDFLSRLKLLEDRLNIHNELRQRFSLAVGAPLQMLMPARFSERLFRLLRARYLLFDVQTPRGGVSLKHSREDGLCKQLADLGFGRAVQEAITFVVFGRVDSMLDEQEPLAADERILPDLTRKIEHAIMPWLFTVAVSSGKGSSVTVDCAEPTNVDAKLEMLDRWRKQLLFHLHESVAALRTAQILDIIRLYPSSTPAVDDLKNCLAQTDYRPLFIKSLRQQFVDKLLNAGTMTSEILLQYVNMIKTLRILDATGVVLESISEPIRSYLRHRPDTIRCIVNGMTVDGDLYAELRRIPSRRRRDNNSDNVVDVTEDPTYRGKVDEDLISIDGDYDVNGTVDVDAYENWDPEPTDAPSKESGFRPGGDAIATLITIYGSSNLLVSEYRTLLADRLINNLSFDMVKEQNVLNLLIDRFGDEAMRECSIMLKDVINSRETLVLMEQEMKNENAESHQGFETTVISKEFWPKLVGGQEFPSPAEFEAHMQQFASTFEKAKKPRKLVWQRGLGVVLLNLNFDDGRSVEVTVSPLQASILLQFGNHRRWKVNTLQDALAIKEDTVLLTALNALASKGLVRATDSSASEYETVEHASDAEGIVDEDGTGGAGVSGDTTTESAEDESQMKVFESYILAMLQNLKQMPLEKVHEMLKMFVKTPVYDKTQDQLAAFLRRMVAEGKIEVQAGLFRIKPKKS